MTQPHISVLAVEVLEWLTVRPSGVYVDGTLGLGGHAALILEKLGSDGRLIGFDKDAAALAEAREVLAVYGERVMLIHDDFKHMAHQFAGLGIGRADGILLDLGVSSMQLDRVERGFSFRFDGPLDMRMDTSQKLTAAHIVNEWPRKDLEQIIFEYGEERFGRRIAERIERERSGRRIETTGALAAIIASAVPATYRHGRIHPATRTFQALRIAVNGEMESLRVFLETAFDALAEGGRLVIISFHSLEDRMVKNAFREWQKEDKGKVLTKKPMTAAEAEILANPRSRSAKLRVFERTKGDGQ